MSMFAIVENCWWFGVVRTLMFMAARKHSINSSLNGYVMGHFFNMHLYVSYIYITVR